jgi:hypothetical protein
MELEIMLAKDFNKYYCLHCSKMTGSHRGYKTKKAFIRHTKTALHNSDDYMSMADMFKKMLYFTPTQLRDYKGTSDFILKNIYYMDDDKIREMKNDYGEVLCTVEEIKRLKDTSELYLMEKGNKNYKIEIIKKVQKYREEVREMTKQSHLWCKDVAGIIAEYI